MWVIKLANPNSFEGKTWFLFFLTLTFENVSVNCGTVAGADLRNEHEAEIENGSDEESKVTFVLDVSDAYEEPHPESFYTSQNDRIEVSSTKSQEYEWCPPLPESVSSVMTVKLCGAVKCQRDDDCSTDGTKVCCFNGCTHSCVPVNPPLAFDWLEETDMTFLRNTTEYENGEAVHHDSSSSEENEGGGDAIHRKVLLQAKTESEVISLPGGCLINPEQYEHLRLFRKDQHVKSW